MIEAVDTSVNIFLSNFLLMKPSVILYVVAQSVYYCDWMWLEELFGPVLG